MGTGGSCGDAVRGTRFCSLRVSAFRQRAVAEMRSATKICQLVARSGVGPLSFSDILIGRAVEDRSFLFR
eukprot:2456162-Pyramimonas_sp.AAC.1